MALCQNDLRIGQTISMDQYVSTSTGHLPHTMKLTGGTLFVDHCSMFIFIHNQVSLGVGETLVGKHAFETLLHSFGFSSLIP